MNRFIEVAGVLRRVVYPPDPGVAERFGLVWRATFVDETDGGPVRSPVRLSGGAGLAPVSAEGGGQAGLAATPATAWPLLAASPAPIAVNAEAEGYLPLGLAAVVTAHPAHPAEFVPASPPTPVEMQGLPVRLEGRVRRRGAAGLEPVAGATVRIAGIWQRAPQAGTTPSADPAEVLEIRPPLTAPAAAGTQVRRVSLTVPGIDTALADSVAAGATGLVLESRAGIAPGDLVMIEPAHPDRVEVARVASVAPLPTVPFRGRVTLNLPLAFAHPAGAAVSRRDATAAGIPRALSRDMIPGGVSVFANSVVGLTATGFLRVGTGAAQQIRRVRAFSAVTDAEGWFRLPPIHRLARAFIDAQDGVSAVAGIAWAPRRDGPVDRLDIELPP